MARADFSSTTSRAPGARPAPTFSTVEEAHTNLIERLMVLKPYRIFYTADAQDIEERAEYQILGAVLDYVGVIVADTGGNTSWAWSPIWLEMSPARLPMRQTTSRRGGSNERHHARRLMVTSISAASRRDC